MATPEQLVDALCDAARAYGEKGHQYHAAVALQDMQEARAALLAAMGGDAVPVKPWCGISGAGLYRKVTPITATQWFTHGDHPNVSPLPEHVRMRLIAVPTHKLGWVRDLEGGSIVDPGDWIATGIKGENWAIKPDIFAATYELIDSATPLTPSAIAEGMAWQTMDRAPKDGTEIPCLTPGYKGPVMLKWFKYNGAHAWRDWDHDIYNPTVWFRLPPAPGEG